MPLALFGITNSGLNLFVNLVILFLVVVWIALIAWTYLDARRRIADSVLVACATGASVFPFVGTVIYTILRPPEFLEDTRERELEMRASELRVRQLEEQSCQNCGYPVERNFLRCPNCRNRVKDPCYSCGQPIDPRWGVCPYCEASVRSPAAAPARRGPPPPRSAPAGDAAGRDAGPRARPCSPLDQRRSRRGRAPGARQPGAAQRQSAQRSAPAQRPAAAKSEAPADAQQSASERPAKARTTRPARRTTASSSRSTAPKQPRRTTRSDDSGE